MPKETETSDAPRRRLHTPDAFARGNLLHLQEIGELAPPGPHGSGRRGLSSFLFLLVESGEGVVESAGTRMELCAGDVAFVDCRAPYSHETGASPWRLRWIHFDGPSLPAIAAEWRRRAGAPAVRAADPARYRRLWEDVWEASGSDSPVRDFRIGDRLSALCTALVEDVSGVSGGAPDRRAARLDRVRDWIESHCGEDVRLDDLAAVAGVNKYTLVREFRARFGMPPSRALAAARVNLAKRLLRFSDDTVETVGARCGVPEASYFARMFRRVEGISPSEFRRNWRRERR